MVVAKVLSLALALSVITSVYSQDIDVFMSKIEAEGRRAVNPCTGIDQLRFLRNPRGCSWYFVCQNQQVIREDRCQGGLRFNYDDQNCDFIDRVDCDFDDRWTNLICPTGNTGLVIIPHPYTCSKFTGSWKTLSYKP